PAIRSADARRARETLSALRASFSVFAFRQAGDDVPVAGHPLRLNAAFFQRLQTGATRFAVVLAVAEAAVAQQVAELDETGFHLVATDMTQAELTDAGGIDQVTALREMEQPRCGGGVRALAGQFRECADLQVHPRQQTVDQR